VVVVDETGEAARFPCPCCGYLTFGEPPGSYAICPICFWEDDPVQLRFPTRGGANVPLVEAQRHFPQVGACEPRLRPYVRPPGVDDRRDPGWHPLDPAQAPLGGPETGLEYWTEGAALDFGDLTQLYYWRRR
jgi:hypothetical protein